MRKIALLASVSVFFLSASASAFVPTPVGGHPGEIDFSTRAAFERGLFEPATHPGSFRPANWNLYQLGVGYTHGTLGPFYDSFFRVDGTFFDSPAEVAETEVPGRCINLNALGQCEFHPSDTGLLLTPAIGANLVHTADFSFGVFLQGSIPVGVDLARFQLPRVDFLAGGAQVGVHVTDWFGFSSRLYLGSGSFGDGQQNAGMISQTLFHLDTPTFGELPWKLGMATGVYFEGDLTERIDEGYNAAYATGGFDDPIRTQRFAVMATAYVQIGDAIAVEGGYLQKLFGNDVPATQFFFAGVRGAFKIVD